jgi:hypothetical protein
MLKKAGDDSRLWRQTFIKQQLESLVKPLEHILSSYVKENSKFSLIFNLRSYPRPLGYVYVVSVLMTAGMKLFVAFFLRASFVAIASRSKFQEKFSSGTKSDLTGTFGG